MRQFVREIVVHVSNCLAISNKGDAKVFGGDWDVIVYAWQGCNLVGSG